MVSIQTEIATSQDTMTTIGILMIIQDEEGSIGIIIIIIMILGILILGLLILGLLILGVLIEEEESASMTAISLTTTTRFSVAIMNASIRKGTAQMSKILQTWNTP